MQSEMKVPVWWSGLVAYWRCTLVCDAIGRGEGYGQKSMF